MASIQTIPALNLSDVFIYPQYSTVLSRGAVDVSSNIMGLKLEVPVMSANMDTVTGSYMAQAMRINGGIGVLHRFWSIKQNVEEFYNLKPYECIVSVGISDESKDRARALYDAGARRFCIDIAHGHSLGMQQMIEWFHKEYTDIYLMAGNVATPEAIQLLFSLEVDAIKVNIAPGAVCVTRLVTGVTVPTFTAISSCSNTLKSLYSVNTHLRRPALIADGGMTEIGDIAKALGAGADAVMTGRMLAGCLEAPGARIDGKKVYRGSASRESMLQIREENQLPTPEGKSILIEDPGYSAGFVLGQIKGGLQSAFSYSNSHNLREFQERVKFGVYK